MDSGSPGVILEETRQDPGHSLFRHNSKLFETSLSASTAPWERGSAIQTSSDMNPNNIWSSSSGTTGNSSAGRGGGASSPKTSKTIHPSTNPTSSTTDDADAAAKNLSFYSGASSSEPTQGHLWSTKSDTEYTGIASQKKVDAALEQYDVYKDMQFHPGQQQQTDDKYSYIQELSTSMNQQLRMSPSPSNTTAAASASLSVAAAASTSSNVSSMPGIVGVSSGSTFGGTTTSSNFWHPQTQATSGSQQQQPQQQQYGDFSQQQYPWMHSPQQPFYSTTQYPIQQQPYQNLSLFPSQPSVNTSFQYDERGDSMYSYDSLGTGRGSTSSYPNVGLSSYYHQVQPHTGGAIGGGRQGDINLQSRVPTGISTSRNVDHSFAQQQQRTGYGDASAASRFPVGDYLPTASLYRTEQATFSRPDTQPGQQQAPRSSAKPFTTSSLQAALRLEEQAPPTIHNTAVDRSIYQEQQHQQYYEDDESATHNTSKASSEAIRLLMNPPTTTDTSLTSSNASSALLANRLPLDRFTDDNRPSSRSGSAMGSVNTADSVNRSILPAMTEIEIDPFENDDAYQFGDDEDDPDESYLWGADTSIDEGGGSGGPPGSPDSKKRDWLLRMNRRLSEVPIGELDPSVTPIPAIMNNWAKTKSAHGASMVEAWLNRAQQEYEAGNTRVMPTNKMYTMAVDAWAKSGEGVSAAQRAEAILQHMNQQYQATGLEHLRPTTGIFNAVINAWARSKERIAPSRAEQILKWMHNLHQTNPSIRPDKYTFNTVIHAYAKAGGTAAAKKAQELLNTMQKMYQQGNQLAKPDTITYNVVINSLAKSGGKEAAMEAEKLLTKMHQLSDAGDPDVKPNVVTYGAVIDAYAKSGEKGAAARADSLLARMIHLHQMDPIKNADLRPNTYVFNTVINAHAKSKEHDAASKAEEMLLAMNRLHDSGMPNLKPDAFTYTAVIDAWAKSGYRGAATRADQLLDKMEAKYLAGDMDLKPNTFTYNAVINALAKSGDPGAAARAERVLHNMVNRHRHGASEDVKPTTINFNSVLDAWAKSGGGRKAAERAEEILEWMDRLYKSGNKDVRPDTITFNAVLDAWARSGDRMAAQRAEQILDHMDDLYRAGNEGVKPDVFTYNTLINAHAKSSELGSAARAEHVLRVMKQRYSDGDADVKPNTRTHTSVIDAWAKSGENGAAKRAEQILNSMIANFEETGDIDVKPNVHTANAVCNACAFTKTDEDRPEALQIAFRVFDWLSSQSNMEPDAYTYTILLSVCSNLLPREDRETRFSHAQAFFDKCCQSGYVNDYVLRKLRQTVSEQEYLSLVDYRGTPGSTANLPPSWTRKVGKKNARFFNKSSSGSSAGGRSRSGRWSTQHRRGGNNR